MPPPPPCLMVPLKEGIGHALLRRSVDEPCNIGWSGGGSGIDAYGASTAA